LQQLDAMTDGRPARWGQWGRIANFFKHTSHGRGRQSASAKEIHSDRIRPRLGVQVLATTAQAGNRGSVWIPQMPVTEQMAKFMSNCGGKLVVVEEVNQAPRDEYLPCRPAES